MNNPLFANGSRKVSLGYVYLIGHFLLAGLIVFFAPALGLTGLAALAAGTGTGVAAVIWGHVKEGQNGGSNGVGH